MFTFEHKFPLAPSSTVVNILLKELVKCRVAYCYGNLSLFLATGLLMVEIS